MPRHVRCIMQSWTFELYCAHGSQLARKSHLLIIVRSSAVFVFYCRAKKLTLCVYPVYLLIPSGTYLKYDYFKSYHPLHVIDKLPLVQAVMRAVRLRGEQRVHIERFRRASANAALCTMQRCIQRRYVATPRSLQRSATVQTSVSNNLYTLLLLLDQGRSL